MRTRWILRNMVVCFIVLGISCKSSKPLQTQNAPVNTLPPAPPIEETYISQTQNNSNSFEYMQVRGKITYTESKQTLNADLNLVMEKDKYIWMSVTAVLGIEAARILITADSVKILDRLHHKYIATDFSYLQQLTQVPLKLNQLQNLLIGNTLFPNSVQKSVVDTLLGNLAIYTLLEKHKQTTFYRNNYKVLKGGINETNQAREMRYTYDGFTDIGSNSFPNHININIRAEKNVVCTLELSNFVFDKKREVQFTVPNGYEVVRP